MRRVIAIAVAVAAVAAPAAAGVAPAIRVTETSPLTIRGAGFKAHERVTVTAYAAGRHVKRVTAGARGGFVVRFTGVSADRCSGFAVRATGDAGSRAAAKLPAFECPVELQPANQ